MREAIETGTDYYTLSYPPPNPPIRWEVSQDQCEGGIGLAFTLCIAKDIPRSIPRLWRPQR